MAYEGLVESPSAEASQLMVTNPLRIIRSGQVPVMNSRTRSASVASSLPPKMHESVRNSVPENLNGTKSDFSIEHQHRRHNFSSNTLPHSVNAHRDENPIPLPPRDRNKSLLAAKPRHTRKHPLIIPPTSLQRTLDKVNTITPPPMTQTMTDPLAAAVAVSSPIYANNVARQLITEKNPEALNFEEEIESNLNALDEIPSEQDAVDGVLAQSFNQIQVVDEEDEGEEKMSSHHVSCEDLLKFANTKPSSRTRGIDSDEVRIMLKVLGSKVTKEKCVEALEQSEWDFMKAIKIIKLQNMVNTDMGACCNALESSDWDVAKAGQWILQQDEVTQV